MKTDLETFASSTTGLCLWWRGSAGHRRIRLRCLFGDLYDEWGSPYRFAALRLTNTVECHSCAVRNKCTLLHFLRQTEPICTSFVLCLLWLYCRAVAAFGVGLMRGSLWRRSLRLFALIHAKVLRQMRPANRQLPGRRTLTGLGSSAIFTRHVDRRSAGDSVHKVAGSQQIRPLPD